MSIKCILELADRLLDQDRLVSILLQISGIDLLSVMYCRFFLTHKFVNEEFSAIKCLNL